MAHIAPAERLQRVRKTLLLLWRDQEMDVVRHQHIGMNRQPIRGGGIIQPSAILGVVLRSKEDRLALLLRWMTCKG